MPELVIIGWWRAVFKGLIFRVWTKGRQLKGSIKGTIITASKCFIANSSVKQNSF